MWKCSECGAWFDEPDYMEVCCERECGVLSLFPDRHYTVVAVCPNCGDHDIHEEDYEEDDDVEE